MADRSSVPGGLPVDDLTIVSVDNTTIQGNGSPSDPLSVIPDALAVVTDDVTIGGDGLEGAPLHAIFPGFYDNVKVKTDGTSIVGSGVTGDPLIATGGSSSSAFIQTFSYTVTGIEPDLANIPITISPSQPDANYGLSVTQDVKTNFLAMSIASKAGAGFTLELSNNATAGDKFDFVVSRAGS